MTAAPSNDTTDKTVDVLGWPVSYRKTEPLVADDVVAKRLEYGDIYKYRQRIRKFRNEDSSNFNPLEVPTQRVETGGAPGGRFLLSEAEALFMVTQTATPAARALTHELIRVFIEARRRAAAAPLSAPGTHTIGLGACLKQNREFATEALNKIRQIAKREGKTFARVHGDIRLAFGVGGYRLFPLDKIELLDRWFAIRLPPPVLTIVPRAKKSAVIPGQLDLFGQAS